MEQNIYIYLLIILSHIGNMHTFNLDMETCSIQTLIDKYILKTEHWNAYEGIRSYIVCYILDLW